MHACTCPLGHEAPVRRFCACAPSGARAVDRARPRRLCTRQCLHANTARAASRPRRTSKNDGAPNVNPGPGWSSIDRQLEEAAHELTQHATGATAKRRRAKAVQDAHQKAMERERHWRDNQELQLAEERAKDRLKERGIPYVSPVDGVPRGVVNLLNAVTKASAVGAQTKKWHWGRLFWTRNESRMLFGVVPILRADSEAKAALEAVSLMLVVASIAAIIVRSYSEFEDSAVLNMVQMCLVGVFTFEYVLRWAAVRPDWNVRRPYGAKAFFAAKLRYTVSAASLVDLAAVFPFYVLLLMASVGNSSLQNMSGVLARRKAAEQKVSACVGNFLDVVCSSARTPHGGASYVQMSKRNR